MLIPYRATEGQVVDEKAPSAGAKSLCIPFDQDRFGKLEPGTKCIGCGADAKRWTMFGRSESAQAAMRGPLLNTSCQATKRLALDSGKGSRQRIDESSHACNTGLWTRYITFTFASTLSRPNSLQLRFRSAEREAYSLSSITINSPTSCSTADCSSVTFCSDDVDRLFGTSRGRVLVGVDRDEATAVLDARRDFLLSSSHLIH
jgi:hypothetical protein